MAYDKNLGRPVYEAQEQDHAARGALQAEAVWSAAYSEANIALRLCALALLVIVMSCFIYFPVSALNVFGLTLSLVIITVALLRFIGCGHALLRQPDRSPALKHYPAYTVLVPMRDEANMVRALMCHLSKLDYPQHKLEIFMICEADDLATTREVQRYFRPPFKCIIVPTSLPATKPKALNVAMQQAKGEIITIYDAEDRPHPDQLKQAARALMGPKNLSAVQAPLSYFNPHQNWLTRQFTLEYDSLFQVWNPLLVWLGLPFPLGGTSNHIKRAALDAAGLWDPHNVTEDADLSFRLSALGLKIGIIDLPTEEEALSDYPNWKRQRMRWQKGFIQSWAVHMRRPLRYGLRRALALQVTLGMTLLAGFLHVPTVIFMTALLIFKTGGLITAALPPLFYATIVMGYSAAILSAAIGMMKSYRKNLWLSLLAMPLYWLFMFWPSVLAALEYIYSPYYWHKSVHGRNTQRGSASKAPNAQSRARNTPPVTRGSDADNLGPK